MKTYEKRGFGFLIIAITYVIATVSAFLTYCLLPFDFWLNLLIADTVATVIVFIVSVICKNASVYDPYWSVQPIIICIGYLFTSPLSIAGLLITVVICFWGIRLTTNWAYTFHGLKHQDWRYTMLCETTGVFYPLINFIGIHMVPTLIVYACTLPAVFIIISDAFSWWMIIGLTISLGATTIQCVADVQMQSFRKNRSSTFIRVGLWKYSRHPNYLGEILMWWGIGLATVCVLPSCWYLLAGALLNTLLFTFVSLPMAETKQSKKEGFTEYKKETRLLLPLPKINR